MTIPLRDLWRHRKTRCQMTPETGLPPFTVAIHDGDKLTILRAFDTHDDACEFAVGNLRRATRTGEPSAS